MNELWMLQLKLSRECGKDMCFSGIICRYFQAIVSSILKALRQLFYSLLPRSLTLKYGSHLRGHLRIAHKRPSYRPHLRGGWSKAGEPDRQRFADGQSQLLLWGVQRTRANLDGGGKQRTAWSHALPAIILWARITTNSCAHRSEWLRKQALQRMSTQVLWK